MNHQSLIQLWVHSSFHIFDIRHFILLPGEAMPLYPLPANAFVLLCRGQGTARLNGRAFTLSRSCLLHGGKGLHLQIDSLEQLKFYLILYKSEPRSSSSSLQATTEKVDALMTAPLSFVPEFPALLHQHAREMYNAWLNEGDLSRFRTKTVFYLFMHEVLRQLDNPSFVADKPDIVDQAIRYMEKAARLLLETDETIQHIAESGYRMFHLRGSNRPYGIIPAGRQPQCPFGCHVIAGSGLNLCSRAGESGAKLCNVIP
ncbi:hypothetical protein B9T62_08280 [Paenibacillus donghaensis]|uniref:Uncharacterized protein n=1 Tax=Paenibacillus donghaensis TaxID=414771 RepID=A0A2Z2KLE1_9BACL|nr:hypothetical protein B9T62_08280 [Paenibacillus donghaensis]